MDFARGNFINNQWLKPSDGGIVRSINPATADRIVLEAPTDPAHAQLAVNAARDAGPAWAAKSTDERIAILRRFGRELASRKETLARAMTQEMGKTIREARIEANSLPARVDLVANQQIPLVKTWGVPNQQGECRYHPLGVIAVLGPYNFPLHLCNAHILPALATGNTVVVKPSERTPLSFQLYMEAWEAAGLPPVLQMVQGGADVGRALTSAEGIHGIAMTGSWNTGHAISKALIDRPEVLVALEMGGQNMAVVLEDANINQALEGVLLGAFMSAGQRCTCTSRVLIQRSIAPEFIDRLTKAAAQLTMGDPMTDVFMGPMAWTGDRDRIEALCRAGREAGAELLLAPEIRDGGAWRGPSLHLINAAHDSDYTREEVFGPDLAITIVDDLDEAIGIINSSQYGLSASIFSARKQAFEELYRRTRMGCVNWNRSTSRQSGAFPFGGVGRSGNYRPAGSDAVRYTTFPVQVQWNEPGALEEDPYIREAMSAADPLTTLEAYHVVEETLEPYGIYPTPPDADSEGFALIVRQELDHPVPLSKAFYEALRNQGVKVELTNDTLKIPLAFGDKASQALAQQLSDAAYSLRHLFPARFISRRPAGTRVPQGEDLSLPRSEALMARLVGDDFVPDDKKPPIIDLFRSSGPYLASVDEDPLIIMDAAGQIATHAAGLNPPQILEALIQGRYSDLPILQPTETAPAIKQLGSALRKHAQAHPHITFVNSGAEANEVALATCATQRPGRKKIIAFRGAFHGRTFLALHETWNPSKRIRFEFDGYQARWVSWPFWPTPDQPAPEPEGWLAAWSQKEAPRHFDLSEDAVLAAEVASLNEIEDALRDDQVVALITEPMQAEGGEQHATPRFFRALRALTSAYDVPMIMDEVQCGFHLGGPFFWHSRFNLPTPPDCITTAKKAQVGVTLSRWPIPVPGETQAASAMRGLQYAELLSTSDAQRESLMGEVVTRLQALADKHPDTLANPRLVGWSFGFDLTSKEAIQHLVNTRLWRGYMIYGAGDLGLRFRLHPEVSSRHVEGLFQRLDAALTDFERGAPASWTPGAVDGLADHASEWPTYAKLSEDYHLRQIPNDQWQLMAGPYEALQKTVYEPARQDDFTQYASIMSDPDAVVFGIFRGPITDTPERFPLGANLVAATLAYPLEYVSQLDGPKQDPGLGRGNTLYSGDLTVHPDHRGKGLGHALKQAQVTWAMARKKADNTDRFLYITGRNRVGSTHAMAKVNENFGAWRVATYTGQYGDPQAQADYYRISLTWPRLPAAALPNPPPSPMLNFRDGLTQRLGDLYRDAPGTEGLRNHLREGRLNGAIVNKLSLCNFATPGLVRSYEWLRHQAPKGLAHLIMASGRAETLDKTLRALKYHRGEAKTCVSLGPVYAGMTTAAARSVTLPADDPQNWFEWPSTADPTLTPDEALEDLKQQIEQRGSNDILAVIIEATYLTTGRSIPADFWSRLKSLCVHYDLPILLLETTTGGYRSGRGMWRADSLPISVDAVAYYPGGQLGLGFVSERYYVDEKLTLISTWDGDELALTRSVWEWRTARHLDIARHAKALRDTLEAFGPVTGEGLYLSLEIPQGELVERRLRQKGIQVACHREGSQTQLRFIPPLNIRESDITQLGDALREIFS